MTNQAKLVTLPGNAPSFLIDEVIARDGGVILRQPCGGDFGADLARETDPIFSETPFCIGEFYGSKTKRIHGLIAKSEACRLMAMNEPVLSLMERLLGPYCNHKIQISLTQGIQIWPGERGQILHRDDTMYGEQSKPHEFMVNAMWAASPFTRDNGATRVVPRSHRWPLEELVDRLLSLTPDDIAVAEMAPGDVLVYLGSLVHSGGENISLEPRSGIVMSYCLGWLRQSENQYFAAPWELARQWPEKLQNILGYAVVEPNLGLLEGGEPKKVLEFGKTATRDFLTPEQNATIKAYFGQELTKAA